eukprot:Awhi_evm1s4966
MQLPCFPDEQRRVIDYSLGTLKLEHMEFMEMEIIAKQAKVLLEELVGVSVELTSIAYTDAEEYLDRVNSGDVDANLAAYPGYDPVYYSRLKALGEIGYTETAGWYMPQYLVDQAPALTSYSGIKEVQKYTELFCTDTNSSTYMSLNDELEKLFTEKKCADHLLTQSEMATCLQDIKDLTRVRNCSLEFLAPPDSIDWSLDSSLLNNLDLLSEGKVNVIYIDENVDDVPTDLLNFAKDKYLKREPFMVFLWSPSPAFSSFNDLSLSSVALPPSTAECLAHEYTETSDQYNCSYSAYRMEMERKMPLAYRFLSRFSITQDILSDLMFSINAGGNVDEEICKALLADTSSFSIPVPDVSQEKQVNAAVSYVVMSLAGILILTCIVQIVMLIVYRDNSHVKTASVNFLYLMVGSAIFAGVWIISLYFRPSKISCTISVWLEAIGFFGLLLALIFKSARIAILFKLSRPSKAQRRAVKHLSDKYMLLYFSVIMLVVLVYLTIWTTVSPVMPITKVISNDFIDDRFVKSYEVLCESSNLFRIIMIAAQLLVLAIECLIAFNVKNIPSSFNESKLLVLYLNDKATMDFMKDMGSKTRTGASRATSKHDTLKRERSAVEKTIEVVDEMLDVREKYDQSS